MKRLCWFICFVFISFFLAAQEIDKVRGMYLDAAKDRQYATEFLQYFRQNPPQSSLLIGYHALSLAMCADITTGKFNQYRMFNQGKHKLDSIILIDADNAEIRYLRFAIQDNAPEFLGYDNREEDLAVILRNIDQLGRIENKELKRVMKSVFLKSDMISEEQKKLFKSKL
ncbi:MAG: hypothetical protein JXA77_09620 [Bacteroidales bacterium]|nr:hypothetical protein [Bacteroidales bacterium]MBN2817428.1 hypothetical protein [Bacteroidales bacterium]